MSIDIVLATFNGERYIHEQLESLLAQSYPDFKIRISDDGSSDGTLSVVSDYQFRYPGKIVLMNSPGGLGPCGNFFHMLKESPADYVFFSDQDDVWDTDKVRLSLNAMRFLEEKHGNDVPLLIHTDLRVVDADLNLISSSFFEFQRLNSWQTSLRDLLLQNVVTGCTVVMNRSLIRKALPFPDDVVMHDWWLALVASAFGHIHYVDSPTLSYRQHSYNQIGAKGWSPKYLLNRLAQLSDRTLAAELGRPVIRQAKVFGNRYQKELSLTDLNLVNQVVGLEDCPGVLRVVTAAKIGLRKHGFLRTVAFYWLLLWADFKKTG